MKEKLNTIDSRVDIEFTTSTPSLPPTKKLKQKQVIFTPELAPESKKMTSETKLNICEKDIQTMLLSKTMAVDSTLNERALSGYWQKSCLATSRKLLSHTETGCVGSDLTCSASLQNNTIANSWFSTSLQFHQKKSLSKILFPLSMCSPVEFMDSEHMLTKSKLIRVYPNKNDLNKFQQYLGLSRYWYNQAVAYLKKPNTKAYMPEVRKIQNDKHPDWALDCPQRIREHAMDEACKAVKNATTKYKQTKIFQKVHFRTKRDVNQRFGFDKKSLKNNILFRKKDHRIEFHATEDYEIQMEGTQIIRKNNRWFLIVPNKVPIKIPESQRKLVVALDPGVRTFQTLFSEQLHGKVGTECFSMIYKLCFELDKLQSKLASAKSGSRRNLKRVSQRLRWKIKDLISDIHHKFAYFLVTNFETVLIPTFETSQMVTKLYSKVARSMLNWAHYRFKQFLKFKAKEYSCKIIEVDESYTSKTCSYCGKIQNIGSKKIIKCSCGIKVDRDYNGARGIYLKNIALSQ